MGHHTTSGIDVPPQSALLYPSATAREIGDTARREPALIVLDGRGFTPEDLRRASVATGLPHVHIRPERPSGYRDGRAEPSAVRGHGGHHLCAACPRTGNPGLDGLLRSFARWWIDSSNTAKNRG
jgi:hypothetical protein